MKSTELFNQKASILLGKNQDEQRDFMKKIIFKNYDYENGFSSKDLIVILDEIILNGGRVVGIETYDENDALHVFNWESYVKNNIYKNDWFVKAIKEIKSLGAPSRSFVYMKFPREAILNYLNNFMVDIETPKRKK